VQIVVCRTRGLHDANRPRHNRGERQGARASDELLELAVLVFEILKALFDGHGALLFKVSKEKPRFKSVAQGGAYLLVIVWNSLFAFHFAILLTLCAFFQIIFAELFFSPVGGQTGFATCVEEFVFHVYKFFIYQGFSRRLVNHLVPAAYRPGGINADLKKMRT
jgi:hypothetical protein